MGDLDGRIATNEHLKGDYWLMDEPFANLDERTRHDLQALLLELVATHSLSVMFVTHSLDEAVFLSDRIAVLSAGPGRVLDSFDPDLQRPRDRLSPEYGDLIERLRKGIESVL